jgi:hypothetical protein
LGVVKIQAARPVAGLSSCPGVAPPNCSARKYRFGNGTVCTKTQLNSIVGSVWQNNRLISLRIQTNRFPPQRSRKDVQQRIALSPQTFRMLIFLLPLIRASLRRVFNPIRRLSFVYGAVGLRLDFWNPSRQDQNWTLNGSVLGERDYGGCPLYCCLRKCSRRRSEIVIW